MIVVEIIDAFYATNIVHGLLFSTLRAEDSSDSSFLSSPVQGE